MRELYIDIETYCDLDLKKVGVYRYAAHESFEILLFAYSIDGGEVQVAEPKRHEDFCGLPEKVYKALADPNVIKMAHNANFEMTCVREFFYTSTIFSQWRCTMVEAAYLGLPFSLDKVADVLNLTEQKDKGGKALVSFFSKPCKPTKANGGRFRNLPTDAPEKWQALKEYCTQDVRTEIEVHRYVERFGGLPQQEQTFWELDQVINGRGVKIDREFCEAAISENTAFVEAAHDEMKRLTGIDNPNSLTQLKAWVNLKTGRNFTSFGKEILEEILDLPLPKDVLRVLELRQLSSNTSVKKYDAMLEYACSDNYIRGLVQFYGANRTGRFSGRGVQVQNLKRTLTKEIDKARTAVSKGVAGLLYDNVSDVVSRLTRTAIVTGYESETGGLTVADFAAIEARVLAWLAGEEWVLEVFRGHGKIYEATAANMFSLPLELIDKDLRQRGKVATLALGYQGSVGALIAMGALRMGLSEDELPAIVSAWRAANPNIVRYWRSIEGAAKRAIEGKTTVKYKNLRFIYDKRYLFIELPNRRRLAYYCAAVERGKITFYGMNQKTKQWCKIDTYGGSLVENITQAVARDCLCDAMLRANKGGHGANIVMHVHDEIICDGLHAKETLDELIELMSVSPQWAEGLPLAGSGFVSKYYKKD
jgi:DNA polymerase